MVLAAFRSSIPAATRSYLQQHVARRSLATISQSVSGQGSIASTSKSLPSQRQTSSTWKSTPDGPLRPPINVEVDPEHGLWSFFRKNEDGKFVSLEAAHKVKDFSGRAWQAQELRRKSFKDLHTLWYISLRERNLVATQNAEMRRIGAPSGLTNNDRKMHRIRHTMGRIKLVLNERRLAYAKAVELHNQEKASNASVSDSPEVGSTLDASNAPVENLSGMPN